jgi:hypothetical protein
MDSSAEVAEWGERWLQQWLAQRPPQDRERDEWVAGNWREVDLEGVMHWWAEDRRANFERYKVNHEVGNLLGLYKVTRNGLAVWRMYRAFRSGAVPLPEWLLKEFDLWAHRLEHARGADAVAAAMEMKTARGGATGAAALKKADRFRRIASQVQLYTTFWGDQSLTLAQAYARVARENRMTVGAVKALWKRWREQVPPGTGPRGSKRSVSSSDLDNAVRKMTGREVR